MHRIMRAALIITGTITLLLAVGFATRQPWATGLWPWPDSRLAFFFVASIAAAIGLPVIWLGVSGEFGAVAAGAINLVVACGGTSGYLALLWAREGGGRLLATSIVFGLMALISAALWLWSRRIPLRDPRPLPRPVRVSFGIFAAVLLPVSLGLIGRASVIFPWPLNPRSSVIYGLIFLGAVAYFLPGVFRPRWGNATGQLLGFLAYDLVLIVPFLQHFAVVKPEHRASLIVYTVVLVYSGTLAVYYLCINPQTRFLATRELPPPVELRPAHA